MRALTFDQPAPDTGSTRVAEVDVPAPGPGEVTIEVKAAGINFIDVMARRGDPAYASSWPFVPGLEAAGTVRELGAGVAGPAVGTPVAAFTRSGGLADVVRVRAELVVPIPDGVSFEQAAVAPGTFTTAALLVRQSGRLRAGETLLMQSAAGGVGQAVAALARRGGAKTLIGIVGSPTRVAAAEKSGYDVVLTRGADLTERVRDLTGGRGVDVILDSQGTEQVDADLDLLAAGGRVVLFGNAGGAPLSDLPQPGRLFAGNASIGGFSMSAMSVHAPELIGAALREVLELVAEGELTLEFTTIDGLAAAADAQQALAEGRGAGKYVVRL
ncbi:NADPH:quinone reductase-like Zn-dependent oxidoreductase [Kribbella rubisoli]|uniref:NADPH:quinone reductase-like Zn-dependent oxidoreductase n=1 Tax=Kribbella rubisoli TaxID=3075929 RepID=A0A4Q7WM40_9ACTN|nr:zinc-binding alcohol dehydrogenase family protein [Kribbella rubisoli]RZU11167.1 NADPH:quinone reductase-like Zn-dependent oxidoreductase [Kribbella rubisoli]